MLKRGFKADAERKAAFYREQLGLKKYDPLPARQLADELKIKLLTPKDIPGIDDELLDTLLVTYKDNWSAAIFMMDERHFIIHHPTHSPFRQESDLMHEIAHSICGHELKGLETVIQGCVLPLRNYDQDQEDEAGWLGGSLQLPRDALFHHHKLRKMNAASISKLFNASEKMVNYRLSVSGVRNIKLRS